MKRHTQILVQQNKRRTERYIHLKHLIDSCKTPQEIIGMEFLVNEYAAGGHDDGRDLLNHLQTAKTKLC